MTATTWTPGRWLLLLAAITLLGFIAVDAASQPLSVPIPDPDSLTNPVETVRDKASEAAQKIREVFEDPNVQIATVAVLIVLGLTLWLLGARAGRLLFALLLGCALVIPGMYLAQSMDLPLWPGAVAGGLVGMLLGVFIFRIGIMLVGMIITTLLAVGIFAVVAMEPDDRNELIEVSREILLNDKQDAKPVLIEIEGQTKEPLDRFVDLLKKNQNSLLIATVIGLAAGLLLQLLARSFMLVLTTSCLGTLMVILGVWLGLTFKGKEPQEMLGLKPLSFSVIVLVMLGLGMLVQLTMTRKREHHESEDEEDQ